MPAGLIADSIGFLYLACVAAAAFGFFAAFMPETKGSRSVMPPSPSATRQATA